MTEKMLQTFPKPTPPLRESTWQEVRPGAGALDGGLDREVRRPRLIDGPADLGARLGATAVAVIGAGSVGLRAIDSLARLGVGELRICDGRPTKKLSLLTHPVAPDEIGVSKALLGAQRAKALAPETRVRFFDRPFQQLPADALAGVSIVVVATDNLAAEVDVSQACLHLAVPAIHASVYGPALVAQVRAVAGGDDGAGPCLACGYTEAEWRDLDRGTRFSCEGDAATPGDAAPEPSRAATVSFAHLCSYAADFAVGELLRQCAGLRPDAPAGEVLEFCDYTGSTSRTTLKRNPCCPLDHAAWRVCTSEADIHTLSPRDLARIAGYGDDELGGLSFRVERHRFVALEACGCSEHPPLGRFVGPDHALEVCRRCGGERFPHPLHSYEVLPGGALAGHNDQALGALGVQGAPTVLVRGPRGATLVRPPQTSPGAQLAAFAGEGPGEPSADSTPSLRDERANQEVTHP